MGSLSIQTRAEEVVAMAEVKNCGLSERTRVKNCKRASSPLISTDNTDLRGLEKAKTLPLITQITLICGLTTCDQIFKGRDTAYKDELAPSGFQISVISVDPW